MNALLAPVAAATDVSPERMAAAGLRAFMRIAEAWKPVSYTHLTLPTSDLV